MQAIRSINTARSPGTPRGDHSSPTIDQLLHDDCSNGSCSSPLSKEHDQEDHMDHQHKKSVLTKVKEMAKKLKHSLSKKKHSHEDTGSPSSTAVSLDEEENDDNAPENLKAPSDQHLHISSSASALEDEKNDDDAPEYLGAPMYESEQAPEACKETIKQQPREVPIVSEKHILSSTITAENEKLGNEILNKHKAREARMSQNNDAVIAEVDRGVSGDSKIQNFEKDTWDKVYESEKAPEACEEIKQQHRAQMNPNNDIVTKGVPSGDFTIRNFGGVGENTWDKGVSVKEYLRQTLEPGENDRALSQVITEAMSPRKRHGHENMGVVCMFKEAVTSLVGNGTETISQPTTVSSSPHIPISTYPQQVTEEENQGRILQRN